MQSTTQRRTPRVRRPKAVRISTIRRRAYYTSEQFIAGCACAVGAAVVWAAILYPIITQ